jgi:hypothetical protein
MTPARTRVLALGIGLLLVLGSPARAQADDARATFAAGVKAFQDGSYELALAKFQEADRSGHAPAITYNIARTYEKLERPQDALDAYEAYVAEAGESGDFTSAAVVAVAQLKARSTRLSIESTPPGAEVTLDERQQAQKTPLTVFVARGSHRIALTLDGWHEERAYDAPGAGSAGQLVFVRSSSQPAMTAQVVAPAAPAPKRASQPTPKAQLPQLDSLVGSLGLSLSAYRFVGQADDTSSDGKTTSKSAAGGLVFGLAIDVGYALSARTALMLRVFGGLGAAEQALATLGAAGPILSYRVSDSWWAGGGIAAGAGRADADAQTEHSGAILDSQITFKTNFALGPSLELGYTIDQNQGGAWVVELLPTVLFTVTNRESTIFVPLMLGYRWF